MGIQNITIQNFSKNHRSMKSNLLPLYLLLFHFSLKNNPFPQNLQLFFIFMIFLKTLCSIIKTLNFFIFFLKNCQSFLLIMNFKILSWFIQKIFLKFSFFIPHVLEAKLWNLPPKGAIFFLFPSIFVLVISKICTIDNNINKLYCENQF